MNPEKETATYPKRPLELYARTAEENLSSSDWRSIIANQFCPFLGKKCAKTRKTDPSITIGTCIVGYSKKPIVICPHRFLEGSKIFWDTMPLLRAHKRGNSIHVVPEISVPGGSIDYFVASVDGTAVDDYVGLEIQTLDTTGTVWPARQKLIRDILQEPEHLGDDDRSYGMNWRMTAKTILMQLHHKAETLELLNKKLVLAIQDVFYDYVAREFSTTSLTDANPNDSVHFHVYEMSQGNDGRFSLGLVTKQSTTAVGIAQMLGMAHDAEIPEAELLAVIRSKLSARTLLTQ